jgi:hypothetical protein
MARFWRSRLKSTTAFAASLLAPCLVASGSADATTYPAPTSQTVWIYNDSPQWLFAELEVGLNASDVWLQSWFKIPNSQIGANPFPTTITNRIYINPDKGIAPGEYVAVDLPLYTQLVNNVVPTAENQFAEWWQGQNMQIFYSSTSAPPHEYTEFYSRKLKPNQKDLTSQLGNSATWPTCSGGNSTTHATVACDLKFVTDPDGTFPKNAPSQLIEATLGARQAQEVVNDSPPNKLDVNNADFDISYVNIAYAPAALGPYKNDQVGYVGTAMPFVTADKKGFRDIGNRFWMHQQMMYPSTFFSAWPRFVFTDSKGISKPVPKLPSPLEVFARLSGANAPADLDPPPHWPDKLWPAIQDLQTKGAKWARECTHSGHPDTPTFCDAMLDVTALLQANYQKYKQLMADHKCTGTPVNQTVNGALSHIYGWTPWTEDAGGDAKKGCKTDDNLLQDTPGYWTWLNPDDHNKGKDYTKYMAVKLEFDQLNYGKLADAKYEFNPWVNFIHGDGKTPQDPKYLYINGAYSYSVDDAVGNIQAEAAGYIVDVGSLQHLENQHEAQPLINVPVGYTKPDVNNPAPTNFVSYQVCSKGAVKPIDPLNSQFAMSPIDPQNCPLTLVDNNHQTYTVKITKGPPFAEFTMAQVDAGVAKWDNSATATNTTNIVDCSGNLHFPASSKTWCCDKAASRGVFAYTKPDPTSAHQSQVHTLSLPSIDMNHAIREACSFGK